VVIIQDILVSDDVFLKSFICHLDKCKGACCQAGDFGAPLSAEEIDTISAYLKEILPYLPEDSRAKIEADGFHQYYKDMDSEGTTLMPDSACVFMNRNELGIATCGIEEAHRDGHTDFKKPISCHLYPIRVAKNEISGFEAINYNQWDICSDACQLGEQKQVRVFEFLKEAIIRCYGEAFFEEMSEAAKYMDSQSELP